MRGIRFIAGVMIFCLLTDSSLAPAWPGTNARPVLVDNTQALGQLLTCSFRGPFMRRATVGAYHQMATMKGEKSLRPAARPSALGAPNIDRTPTRRRWIRGWVAGVAAAGGGLLWLSRRRRRAPPPYLVYLPEILHQSLTFTTVQPYSSGNTYQVLSQVSHYIDRQFDIIFSSRIDRNAPLETQKLYALRDRDELTQRAQLTEIQQALWKNLWNLGEPARQTLFGTRRLESFREKAFFDLFLFGVPRYLAGQGIFTMILPVPSYIPSEDRIVHSAYTMDFREVTQVESFPTRLWGESLAYPRVILGDRAHAAGLNLPSPISGLDGSHYGNIVVQSETIAETLKDLRSIRGASEAERRLLGDKPRLFAYAQRSRGKPLALANSLRGILTADYLATRSDQDIQDEVLETISIHEAAHLRLNAKRLIRFDPPQRPRFSELKQALATYNMRHETEADLGQLSQGPVFIAMSKIIVAAAEETRDPTDPHFGVEPALATELIAAIAEAPVRYGFFVDPQSGLGLPDQIAIQFYELTVHPEATHALALALHQSRRTAFAPITAPAAWLARWSVRKAAASPYVQKKLRPAA